MWESDFRRYLRDELLLSEYATAASVLIARRFLAWFPCRTHRGARRAGPDDLRAFLGTTSRHPATRNSYRQGLVRFFDWLKVEPNPARAVKRLPMQRPRPRAIPWGEVGRMVQAASTIGPEHHAMAVLLAGVGLRALELRRLTWACISFDFGTVRIPGAKGRGGVIRWHVVPAPDWCFAALREWHRYCPSAEWLFPSPRDPDRMLSASAQKDRWTQVRKVSGVDASMHVIRHSYATHLFEVGADVLLVCDALGHSGPDVTAVYIKLSTSQLERYVRQLEFSEGSDRQPEPGDPQAPL